MIMAWVALAARSAVGLELASPQSSVLVAEPVKIVLTWHALEDPPRTIAVEDEEFTTQVLVFEVTDARNKRRVHRECIRTIEDRVRHPWTPRAGERLVQTRVLLLGCHVSPASHAPLRAHDALFPDPGRYQLRVIYDDSAVRVESNALSFDVSEPVGDELVVFRAIQKDLSVLGAPGGPDAVVTSGR